MLTVKRPTEQPIINNQIIFVETLEEFEELNLNNIQLAVWRRDIPSFVEKLADPSIDSETLPRFMGIVSPDMCLDVLRCHLLENNRCCCLSENDLCLLLLEIDKLVRVFSLAAHCSSVLLKLEAIENNRCRFWHQDSVPMRLVATYRGPCTEYVLPEHGQATLKRRKRNSIHAKSLSHADVALFKGKGVSSPSLEGVRNKLLNHEGIVHRSPRIDGHGIHRLVLVLDVAEEWHYGHAKDYGRL